MLWGAGRRMHSNIEWADSTPGRVNAVNNNKNKNKIGKKWNKNFD